jgi:hypothetical protein
MTHINSPQAPEVVPPVTRRRWRAYGLSAVVSIALFGAWFVGPDAALWAKSQNRPAREFPAVSLESLGNTDTYLGIEQALGDQLRSKYPIVKFLNEAALTSTGLTLSSRMTNGSPLPSFFPAAGIDTNLYYGQEFVLPCSRDPEVMRTGMAKWESALEEAGKTGIYMIPPNKSTVMLDIENPWAKALMRCSVAGRADLVDIASEFSSLHLISPEDVRATSPNPPYWTGDTHWNSDSAETLVTAIQESFAGVVMEPAPDVAPHEIQKPQDLLFMLGVNRQLSGTSAHPSDAAVNLEKRSAENGALVWTFETVGAPATAPTALFIVDSFVYATDITAKLLSQFKSGYMIQWPGFKELANLEPVDVIVLETVERASYKQFAFLGKPELRDYIARPVK